MAKTCFVILVYDFMWLQIVRVFMYNINTVPIIIISFKRFPDSLPAASIVSQIRKSLKGIVNERYTYSILCGYIIYIIRRDKSLISPDFPLYASM